MKNNAFATWRRFFVRQLNVFATYMACRRTKQNNDFTKFDNSTLLQHQGGSRSTIIRFRNTDARKTCKAKQRFHEFFVPQFYVFATLMSGKQSKTTISRIQNTKKREKKHHKCCAWQAKHDFERRFVRNQKNAQVR